MLICRNFYLERATHSNTMDQALLDQAGGAYQQVADQETATPPPSGRSSVVELDSNQEEVLQGLELLSTHLNKILETQELSDVTIKCGPSEFKAHRDILAARSPVFKKILEEDKQGEIPIKKDMRSDTVEIMLDYIYTSKLPRVMEYVQLEDLIGAADFYALLELKTICFNHITKELTLDNICDLVRLAHFYSAPEPVKEKLIGFSLDRKSVV